MSPIAETKTLRAIFGNPNATFSVANAMKNKSVVLVNIGGTTEMGLLYGSLLVSQFQQAAFRRHKLEANQRPPFYLYIDEFENFQSSAFDVILSQGGKFQLCLTLANQWIEQLDSKIKAATFGSVSTFFFFRLAPQDATFLKGEIPSLEKERTWHNTVARGNFVVEGKPIPFDASTLTRLLPGQALYRAADGTARFVRTPLPTKKPAANYAENIKNRYVDKTSCDTEPPVVSLGSNGNQSSQSPPDPKDEDVKPSAPPNVPSHGDKA